MKKYQKRTVVFSILLFVLIEVFSTNASAKEEGYPYDDPNLSYYLADEYEGEKLFTGGDCIYEIDSEDKSIGRLIFPVQIWGLDSNSERLLLQQDLYNSTVTGLPVEFEASVKDKYSQNFAENQYYSIHGGMNFHIINQLNAGSNSYGNPDNYMKYAFPNEKELFLQPKEGETKEFTAEKITYAGYPAYITKKYSKTEKTDENGNISLGRVCNGEIFIFVTDIPLIPEQFHSKITFNDTDLTVKEKYEKIGNVYAVFSINYTYQAYLNGKGDMTLYSGLLNEAFINWENNFKSAFNKYDNSIKFETEKTTDIRVYSYKPVGNDESIDTEADDKKGETSVAIPVAIAIAVIGGIAAAFGAGVGGDSGNSKEKNDKNQYRMYFRKDFGDAIKYDSEPVTVYARIAEITQSGEEIDRPDLSANIDIFSNSSIKVDSTAMTENYMGALIYAKSQKDGQNPDSGILSVRFSGEGSSFQNNITFRLVSKPYISFPEQGNYLTMTLPMILGDEEVYETPVILHDFIEKPTILKTDIASDAPFSCELSENSDFSDKNAFGYVLKVKNNSQSSKDIAAVKQTFGIGIIAENDKEKVENSVNADIYPEGLSIKEVTFDEKGYVVIDTFDDESTEEWGDVAPTSFTLDFVIAEQNENGKTTVRVFSPDEFNPVFGGLKGTDERTNNLAAKFKYEITENTSNLKEYKFAPEEALVEEKDKPYYVTLPISVTFAEKEYTLNLPIRLLGGGPGPLFGWDEAFAHMKRVVSRVGGISPEMAKLLREKGKDMSTAELRLVTYKICDEAVKYYTKTAEEYEKIAAKHDTMIYYAEWLKWFGDQAFSYLMTTYYGPTAEAILSPTKDIFVAFLGEVSVPLISGYKIEWESLEISGSINEMVDNLMSNFFDDKLEAKNITPKQICKVLAGFLVWKMAKNIYENIDEDGKVDLYAAITATAGDLTELGMKKLFGSFFEKALESKSVQNMMKTPVGKWIEKNVPDMFKGRWDMDDSGGLKLTMKKFEKSKIVETYLEGFVGLGSAKVTELGVETLEGGRDIGSTLDFSAWPQIDWVTTVSNDDGKEDVFKVSINLGTEAIGKFLDYVFEAVFSNIPFITKAETLPKDPPFFPDTAN